MDLRLLGDCFRARDLDRETRNYRQDVLGAFHPYTLHSASMLARDMREAGDYAGPPTCWRRPTTLPGRARRGLRGLLAHWQEPGGIAQEIGRLDDAYALTNEIDGRYERSYEADHPDSLACKLNLACDLSARDEKHAAVEVASQSRGLPVHHWRDHPFTLVAENNISTYLRGVGKAREALALVDRTLSAMRASLDDDHPFTLSCQINKANCLHDLGRLSETESLQRETLERLKKTLGASHPDTQVCEANLSIVLRAQGRVEEAEALQRKVITELSETLGNDHPSITALREWRLQNRDLEAQPT